MYNYHAFCLLLNASDNVENTINYVLSPSIDEVLRNMDTVLNKKDVDYFAFEYYTLVSPVRLDNLDLQALYILHFWEDWYNWSTIRLLRKTSNCTIVEHLTSSTPDTSYKSINVFVNWDDCVEEVEKIRPFYYPKTRNFLECVSVYDLARLHLNQNN
jgi:hypothetical protein